MRWRVSRSGTIVLVLVVTVAIVIHGDHLHTASTATFLLILGAVAVPGSIPGFTVPVALAASMAFMMLVATPPNAIVFSYEKMKLSDMVRQASC